MQPGRRMHPEQYVDTSTAVLAGVVEEWAKVREQAEKQATPEEMVEVLLHLTDAAIAWGRRRGLGDDRLLVVAADVDRYLAEHPLSDAQAVRVGEKIAAVGAQRVRTLALLRRMGRA